MKIKGASPSIRNEHASFFSCIKMSKRRFEFTGTDPEYIDHLERWLMTVLPCLGLDQERSAASVSSNFKTNDQSVDHNQFIEWRPKPTQGGQPAKPSQPNRALRDFIKDLPTEARWLKAQEMASVSTRSENQSALKLILGHAGVAIFKDDYPVTDHPPSVPGDHHTLIERGYQYGSFVARCDHDRIFAQRVVAFQDLVFCSYCEVMAQEGVSCEVTNHIMRIYTGDNKSDLTLKRYRLGAVWANRCMAGMLANGWGHRSWEVFLLGKFPPE